MGYGFGAFLLMLVLIMIGVIVAVVGLMLLVLAAITWWGRRSRAVQTETLPDAVHAVRENRVDCV